jgi:uncharacterized protein
MLATDAESGEVKRFLTGPRGCEITGVIMTPDGRTMFVNVQHPGESTTCWDARFGVPDRGDPTTVSSWPFGSTDPITGRSVGPRPRSATVVITRKDGGTIGS